MTSEVHSLYKIIIEFQKCTAMDYQKNLFVKINSYEFFLILVAILGTSLSTAQYDNTYYVTPNVSMCTNIAELCQEFKTYFNNISYFQSKTQFIFLPGVHLFDLGSVLSVLDIVDIRLVGSENLTQHSVAENVKEYGFNPYSADDNITYFQSSTSIVCTNLSGLLFSNVTNLTLANLTLLNCGQYSSVTSQNASIHISSVYNLSMEGVSVQNSTGYGLVGVNVLGQSHITRSSFVANNQIVKDILQHMPQYSYCRNEVGTLYTNNGSFDSSNYTGGNIYLHYDDNVTTTISHQLNISFIVVALGMDALFNISYDRIFTLYGTGLSLVLDQSYNITISIDSLVTYRNQGLHGPNLCIVASSSTSEVTLTNMYSSYATSIVSGAFYYLSSPSTAPSKYIIKDSTFQCNYGAYGDAGGSSLGFLITSPQSINVENCTFALDYGGSSLMIYINISTGSTTKNDKLICISECSFYSMTSYTNANAFLFVQTEKNGYDILIQVSNLYTQGDIQLSGYPNTNEYFTIYNSTFWQSTIFAYDTIISIEGNNTFIQSGITTLSSKVYLKGNNTFINNIAVSGRGGAISLVSSSLYFTGNSKFIRNTASYGGAIFVDSSSSISFISPTNVSFINNTAFLTGGAIYVETSVTSNTCFYMLNCTDFEDIDLYFEGNYAGDAGSVLYGGNIDVCQIDPTFVLKSSFVFDNITRIGYHDNSTSLISSDSPCIFSCTSSLCLTSESVYIYPGQALVLTFVTLGQRYSIVPTAIIVYSNAVNQVIGALKTVKQCSSYVIPYELKNGTVSLKTPNSNPNGYILNLLILPCPTLFVKDDASSSCICDPLLQRNNLVCNISDITVLNTGNIWIGLTSQGVPAFQSPCPFDYCTQNKTINVLDLDSQCSYSRSGVLCGGCHENLSMTFGTSKCASCSNYYLLLIMMFIIMGVVLVGVLLLFNFTVTNGALNGIVLYANIIRINDTIFFRTRSGYSYFLSTVIAWINLDFGIEVCFYDGMTSYAKTWLQFVFPAYVFSLVGGVILAGRYSTWISKLNAVPVLSTLVLLSYSKILRTIITIFSPVSLETLNSSWLVWQYDGNMEYLGREHLPLFIFGLLVTTFFIIPYSTILLMTSWLQAKSHWRCLQWVNKLKPFFDSYQAPFKDRYRFWPGVLLFIRLPLYLVFTLSPITAVKMLAIVFCAPLYLYIVVALSVYKNWSVLLIETFFFANILILSGTVLAANNNQLILFDQSFEVVINIVVTCAMLLLLVIVTYQRLQRIVSILFPSCRKVSTLNAEAQPLLEEYISTTSGDGITDYSSEYREPLLDD